MKRSMSITQEIEALPPTPVLPPPPASSSSSHGRRKCPYLDTIDKQVLDFDFEKVCSISLSNQNVYACLVCGKYFQGRGVNTHAYTHSLNVGHHVFVNLHTDLIYCLPDNYQVLDTSLKSIQDALRPSFRPSDILTLDSNRMLCQDAFGVSYLPGFIGMNNLKQTDYINVILHALAHIPPLRNYFLNPENYTSSCTSELVLRFGEIVRKMWSRTNFKNTISPHELVQEISRASNKRFVIGIQNESIDFLSWFLNELHRGLLPPHEQRPLKKKKKKKAQQKDRLPSSASIIQSTFRGSIQVTTESEIVTACAKIDHHEEHTKQDKKALSADIETVTRISPFLFLSLDLPTTPLFKDSQGTNIIPQIQFFTVMEKFNGQKRTFMLHGSTRQRKRYVLQDLPRYLIFHIARFTKNNFFVEKNPTIVNFPVKNLDLNEFVKMDTPGSKFNPEQLQRMSIRELSKVLEEHEIPAKNCVEKSDLEDLILSQIMAKGRMAKYDLLANICHDSPINKGKETTVNRNPLAEGTYRIHVKNRATEQWYEIQDLHVQETMPQLISQSESYLMIYEQQV